jgi:Alba
MSVQSSHLPSCIVQSNVYTDDKVIRITKGGNIKTYIKVILHHFQNDNLSANVNANANEASASANANANHDTPNNVIRITAQNNAISKAISITEIVKRKLNHLHQHTSFYTIRNTTIGVDAADGAAPAGAGAPAGAPAAPAADGAGADDTKTVPQPSSVSPSVRSSPSPSPSPSTRVCIPAINIILTSSSALITLLSSLPGYQAGD